MWDLRWLGQLLSESPVSCISLPQCGYIAWLASPLVLSVSCSHLHLTCCLSRCRHQRYMILAVVPLRLCERCTRFWISSFEATMIRRQQRRDQASKERKRRLRGEKKSEKQRIQCLEKELQVLVDQMKKDFNLEFTSSPAPQEPYGDEFVNRKKMTRHKCNNLMVSEFFSTLCTDYSFLPSERNWAKTA